jgi:imidazolonepropionase
MKLIGPFVQLLPMTDLPKKGAITNDQMPVLSSAGVLVDDGRVVEVGSFEALKAKADQVEELEYPAVAMPGWIDCHTHMLWGGSRAGDFEKRNSGVSYQQILEEGGGIFDTVQRTKEASDEQLLTGLNDRLVSHLIDGITTVEIKSGYGLSDADELRMLRLINQAGDQAHQQLISTFLGAHVCPLDYNKEEYLTFLSYEVFPKLRAEALTHRVDIFVEENAFSADLAFPYLQKAKSQGFDLTVHANQFTEGGAYLAAKLGAKSADHLEHIDDEEIAALAKSDTVAVALPGASVGLGAPFAPGRKLLDAGASFAIATDWNPGSAPQGDLICQAAMTAVNARLTTAETFAAVTTRAADALGLVEVGHLGKNALADMVIYPTSDYREILYNMGSLRPSETIIKGEIVVSDVSGT